MFTLTFKYCQNIDEITDIQNRNPTDQKIKFPAMQKMSSIRSHTKILLQESTMRWPNVLADTYPPTCIRSKNAKPKCVHCGKNHPANYRECVVAKELQRLKIQKMKKSNLPVLLRRQIQKTKTDQNNPKELRL